MKKTSSFNKNTCLDTARTVNFVLVLILVSFFTFFLNGCGAEKNKSKNAKPSHLFTYSHNDILGLLKKAGYIDFNPGEIRKNSAGNILYLNDLYRNSKDPMIVSVSKGGLVKKLVSPAKIAYLNDKGEFVAWFNDIKKGIQFKNGITKNVFFGGTFDVDASGQYFILETAPGITGVFSIENPNKPVGSTKIKAEKIFLKEGELYLFARNYRNVIGPGHYEQHEIICQVMKKTGSKFELEREIYISRPSSGSSPFTVVDLDPWSDNVLIINVYDPPSSSSTSWYLFDLKTNNMTKIGPTNDYGVFLEEDIFKPQNN
jgi:hypothetical protein